MRQLVFLTQLHTPLLVVETWLVFNFHVRNFPFQNPPVPHKFQFTECSSVFPAVHITV